MAGEWIDEPWLRRLDERFDRIDARFDSIERTMLVGFAVVYATLLTGYTATFVLLAIKL